METNISNEETLGQEQNQESPSGMVQEHQSTSKRVLLALCQFLPKAENVALKEPMASEQVSLEKYQKLLGEKDILAATLCMVRNDMEGILKAAKGIEKQFKDQCREMHMQMKEKEEEIHSLKKTLHLQKVEMEGVVTELKTVQENLEKKVHQADKMEVEIKFITQKNTELQLTWEQKYQKLLGQKDSLATTLCLAKNDMEGMLNATKDIEKQFKDHCREMDMQERKVRQVTLENNNLIATVTDKEKALVENMMKLSQKEIATKQCEKEWTTKNKALEDQLALQGAEKEASSEKAQELQRKVQQMEDEWRHKESRMEEEIKLLIQKNAELQELADKTDKEKAEMRKREKKAQKEIAKRLEKERKEKEKREKKEKKEREKEEKEKLKREKKEQEEREKNEKKERERKEKKAKKEKDEREKQEKKERKEREKREKKEKKERKVTSFLSS